MYTNNKTNNKILINSKALVKQVHAYLRSQFLFFYNTNSVCLSVKYRRPNCWTDYDQIWHAYADRSGDGSYLKKLTPHPRGVEVGILGGSKNQKSRKWHELSRIFFLDPPHPGGSRGVGGQNFKSLGNFTNCRENR